MSYIAGNGNVEHDLSVIKQAIDRSHLIYGGNGQVAVDGTMLDELVESARDHLECPDRADLEQVEQERDEAQNETTALQTKYDDLRYVAVNLLVYLKDANGGRKQYARLREALGDMTTEELNNKGDTPDHAHADTTNSRGKTADGSTETGGSGRTGKGGSKPRNS